MIRSVDHSGAQSEVVPETRRDDEGVGFEGKVDESEEGVGERLVGQGCGLEGTVYDGAGLEVSCGKGEGGLGVVSKERFERDETRREEQGDDGRYRGSPWLVREHLELTSFEPEPRV